MRWALNLLAGVLIRRGRFGDRDAHGVGGGGGHVMPKQGLA